MWKHCALGALLLVAFFYGEHCALHGLANKQKMEPAFHSHYDDMVILLGVAKAKTEAVAAVFKTQQAQASNNGGTAEHTLHARAEVKAKVVAPAEAAKPEGKPQTTSQRAQLASEMLNLPLK